MGAAQLNASLDPSLLAEVTQRYLEVNGTHPMTPTDDDYVRHHFVPVSSDETLLLMLGGLAPLPSYVLSDGTPMVPETHGGLARVAGGLDRLHDWFLAFWPDDPATGEAEWEAYLSGRHVWLREVTPVRIRQQAERVAQAKEAVEILRRRPHDPLGRGMLGEAIDGVLGVTGLDALLLPMTNYDRARFGGPSVRETWVDRPRREFLTPAPPMLPVRTERLVLRGYEPRDEEAFRDAWATEEWTSLLLTLPMNRAEVTDWIRRRCDLTDDMFLGLVAEHDGHAVGDSILMLGGTGVSEAEIGWTVLPAHAGKGYATEAARAMLEIAFEHYGLRRVIANLDARNDRSAAVCERLGMRLEAHRIGDFWSKGCWTDSFEYALLADEWRDARSRGSAPF